MVSAFTLVLIIAGRERGRERFFYFFLSASLSVIARVICVVAGIVYLEELVRSGIHSTSVIARGDLLVSAIEIGGRPV